MAFSLVPQKPSYNFPREMWKPVNTAVGFYYALVIPEYNYIAWDLLTTDFKAWKGLERDTFAEDLGAYPGSNNRWIVNITAGVEYPPDYYKVIIELSDNTGYLLCVRNDHGNWEIDCVWNE
jgi:hypothetical protein